jgi:biotin carboxyl carrier protein
MPGKIFKVLLKEGDSVKIGDIILIMEAMKMEHAIKANKDGVVSKILFGEGEQVSGNSALCELE